MKLNLKDGKYVVAVSGGVDSVALLHALVDSHAGLELVVAHFDHGIRVDSVEDRLFVQQLAASYKLPFFYEEGKLGSGASEATAREARYAFLKRVQKEVHAQAIMTAHHQDDRIETAIINLVRGTGRRGLSSLRSTAQIQRPLLHTSKQDIRAYAQIHQLVWREDSTNSDVRYLRNYVRKYIMPKTSETTRQQFLHLLDSATVTNDHITALLDELLQVTDNILKRRWFILLPHSVAKEVIVHWLRRLGIGPIDRLRIEHIVVQAKTLQHGKLIDIDAQYQLNVTHDTLALNQRERS